jgi:hypothetical protein
MDPKFLNLFFKAVLGVVTYAVALMFVRRQFGENGYARFTTFLPLLLWIPLDIGLLLMSIFMTMSTYRNWAPAEYLADIPLVARWFTSSQMTISDWMVIVLSVVFWMLAHKMVYGAMLVRDRLRQGQERSRDFLFEAAGCAALILLFSLFYYGWESPIYVLRFAENLGVPIPTDIGQIQTLNQLLGKSWLLHAAYYGMPLVCLIVPVFSTYAFLGFHGALQQDDTMQAIPTSDVQTVTSDIETGGDSDGQELRTAQVAQTSSANTEAEMARVERDNARQRTLEAEQRTAEAEERAARAVEVHQLTPELVLNGTNGHNNGHLEHEQIQELIRQVEDERDGKEQAEAKTAALTQQLARNPLLQPNRADIPHTAYPFTNEFNEEPNPFGGDDSYE